MALPTASWCAAPSTSAVLHSLSQEAVKIHWGGDLLYDTSGPDILRLLYVNFLYAHQNYCDCKYNG